MKMKIRNAKRAAVFEICFTFHTMDIIDVHKMFKINLELTPWVSNEKDTPERSHTFIQEDQM